MLLSGGTVVRREELPAALQDVGEVVGMDALYAIEARTTERALYES
jgi:hypothetical protein